MMIDATFDEFPFVAEMPKREKSKVMKVWEHFRELSRISEVEGMLIPMAYAALVLDVCRQRVYQLADDGRLKVIEVNGHQFVTERSVVDYAATERKAGRPLKRLDPVIEGNQTALQGAMGVYRDEMAKRRKAKESVK